MFCGDECSPGENAILLTTAGDLVQCAWCHYSEFGVWPHGMTMEDDANDGTEGAG